MSEPGSETVIPIPSPAQTALDLRTVVARLLRRFREAGADDSLTPSQASALARLGKGGVSTVSALAAAERVRPQSMAATVETLESAGFVTRSQDPSDGRRQIIDLTDAGWARIEGQKDAAAAWLEHALTDLDPADLRAVSTAMAVLERMLP
ncbi:MarR family winged helix-turn-helix transcriptional regulator [Microbacterium sp. 22303]|uniref:MarR family winged helix-turn-helix transcriptional regulator n=1 Tax=unclassified Microbacterium TaxID=2609290 RepID=UPI003F83DEA6